MKEVHIFSPSHTNYMIGVCEKAVAHYSSVLNSREEWIENCEKRIKYYQELIQEYTKQKILFDDRLKSWQARLNEMKGA